MWLSVWSGNARAIAFYTKVGFVDAGAVEFWLGPDRQMDRVMVAPLGSGA
jgi:ribosomal protein S18 acetylase RimI-like enzyme